MELQGRTRAVSLHFAVERGETSIPGQRDSAVAALRHQGETSGRRGKARPSQEKDPPAKAWTDDHVVSKKERLAASQHMVADPVVDAVPVVTLMLQTAAAAAAGFPAAADGATVACCCVAAAGVAECACDCLSSAWGSSLASVASGLLWSPLPLP